MDQANWLSFARLNKKKEDEKKGRFTNKTQHTASSLCNETDQATYFFLERKVYGTYLYD